MGMAPCVSGRLSSQEGFSRGMVVKESRGSHAIFGEHESDLGYRKKPRTEVTSAFSGLCCRLSFAAAFMHGPQKCLCA